MRNPRHLAIREAQRSHLMALQDLTNSRDPVLSRGALVRKVILRSLLGAQKSGPIISPVCDCNQVLGESVHCQLASDVRLRQHHQLFCQTHNRVSPSFPACFSSRFVKNVPTLSTAVSVGCHSPVPRDDGCTCRKAVIKTLRARQIQSPASFQ
jgi:hypothetical protein